MLIADSGSKQTDNTDLTISFHGCGMVHFVGTRAQLVAEGLISEDHQMPTGRESASWKEGLYKFILWRTKSNGSRIKKTELATIDCWTLMRNPSSIDSLKWQIAEKMREIDQIKFRHSDAGRVEFNKFWAADHDSEYQAFKQLIPCLAKSKPGRKPKNKA